ncbi:MAG TPA: DUF1501 domain-containing protein [Bryobacteraceae bacterium]|nr:DUF1501 domain-containing protein [Bryobacteraceae bacterium]
MNVTRAKLSRRSVLQTVWSSLTTAGVGAVLSDVGTQRAFAARANGRAVVCIYLFGGNDANNMIVPLSQYGSYAAARVNLAIAQDELLPVRTAATQEDYGFHPSLTELQPLFQSGAMAVAANVGSADGPATIDSSLHYFRPGYATPGWAADAAGVGAPSDSGSLLSGLPQIGDLAREVSGALAAAREPAPEPVYSGFPNLLAVNRQASGNPTSGIAMLAPGVALAGNQRAQLISESVKAARTLQTVFPETGLGAQLLQAAGLLKVRKQFGIGNQAFLCSLGGFTSRLDAHADLLKELSSAMAAFYRATEEMGIAQSVTTYTDSEYSRTLRPNRQGGTDPAWGAHHLVLGGAVLGANVYGRFPTLAPGGPDDISNLGIFKPSQSKDQYAATFASWFGMEYPEVVKSLPRITRYPKPLLGFIAG